MVNQGSPQLVSLVDPYVYQTIKKLIGSRFVIQTVRDTVRGRLIDVKPDHITIEGAPKFCLFDQNPAHDFRHPRLQ